MSRVHTKDEMRAMFLDHVRDMARYWGNLPDKTPLEKCQGLAFSILVVLDGESALPSFLLVPSPHPDDRRYHEEEGSDFWPDPPPEAREADIAGGLHDEFHD